MPDSPLQDAQPPLTVFPNDKGREGLVGSPGGIGTQPVGGKIVSPPPDWQRVSVAPPTPTATIPPSGWERIPQKAGVFQPEAFDLQRYKNKTRGIESPGGDTSVSPTG